MKEKSKKIYNSITNVNEQYIEEAQKRKRGKKSNKIMHWGTMAACFAILCLAGVGITLSGVFQSEQQLPSQDTPIVSPIVDSTQNEDGTFVNISSLLVYNDSAVAEQVLKSVTIPIEKYMGIYEKTSSVDSDVLSKSIGKNVNETKDWYYVSGHTDLQYLILKEENEYSLWKFQCFNSENYPYSEVLKVIYQIESADNIVEIKVNPATMDNTDIGKEIQQNIGTQKITGRDSIETVYEILTSLTCYGSNRWDIIDYGSSEAASDTEAIEHQAVTLGRYLTLTTDYGNEIDGLKYTAVSNMFYEFSGIAYESLTTEQAMSICEILNISANGEKTPTNKEPDTEIQQSEENQANETDNSKITLEYVTELQNKISDAMVNKELPFVIMSAIYENPYRIHVVVNSNAESDLQKLKAFDELGALEIEYMAENGFVLE